MMCHPRPNSEFVSNGKDKLKSGLRKLVREEVELEFSERLENGGFFVRLFIRWKIRRETAMRSKKRFPSEESFYLR